MSNKHHKYVQINIGINVVSVKRCKKTIIIRERTLMWLHFFIRSRSESNSKC